MEGVLLRQGPHEHEELNVKGSSIAPPSDVTADVMVSARTATVDLHRDARFDEISLNWGWSLLFRY